MTFDLHTLNAAELAIREAIQRKQTEWQQMAAADAQVGNYVNANQLANWEFAAKLLSWVVCSEISSLYEQSLATLVEPADAKVPELVEAA